MVKRSTQSGVTLIELIVVIGIFGVVSAVLLFNYSDFSTNVSLRNLSQDIALTLRKAQSFATSVQQLPGGGVTTDYPSYGVSFSPQSTSTSGSPSSKHIIFFADIPNGSGITNGMYDNGGSCGAPIEGRECIEDITINTADAIVSVCHDVGGVRQCSSSAATDVLFKRPTPDATICFKTGGVSASCDAGASSYVDIVVESPKGLTKTITVWNTGQIAVQ